MSDELKEVSGTEENELPVSDADNTADEVKTEEEALTEELEQLRDTFQEQLDETVAEAEKEPVIQELETGDEDPEEEEEEVSYPAAKKSKKKKHGKKSRAGKIIAIVLAVCAVVLIAFLGTYVVITVKNPNIMTFMSHVAAAESAESYEEKMSAYSSALECCEDEGAFTKAMKDSVTDKMIELTYEEKGFASAYSYINSKLSDEEIENTSSASVKKILEISESVKDVASKAVPAVVEAVKDDGTVDTDAVMKDYNVPKEAEKDISDVMADIKEGLEASAKAESLSDYSKAGNKILDALSVLSSYGADMDTLSQSVAVKLFDKGWLYEAFYVTSNANAGGSTELTDEFKAVKDYAEPLSKLKVSAFELAEKVAADGKVTLKACADIVKKETKLKDKNADIFAQIVYECAQAAAALENKDLTAAGNLCTTAISAEKVVGITDTDLDFFYVKVLYKYNLSTAYSMTETLLTEDAVKKLSASQKAEYEEMKKAFDALSKTSEIFSTYYQSYYQSGTPIDFDEASKALDDYLKTGSNRFDKGFVSYCKYFAKACSSNTDGAEKYLLEAKENIPEFIAMFALNLVESYLGKNDIKGAAKVADEVLAINKTDAYSLSVKALQYRSEGDIDKALKTVVEAADSGAESNYCAKEAGIDYLLKEDYENAYKYIRMYYDSVANSYYSTYEDIVSACELAYILDGSYKAEDDLKKDTSALMDEVNALYANYQLKHLSDAEDVVAGKKTLEDIFLNGTYNFDFSADSAEE